MGLDQLLAKQKVVIFDGAMGTELARRDIKPGAMINLDYAEQIKEIHLAYAEAGADIITTNTFILNRISCEAYGPNLDLKAVNLAGVKLAREAAVKGALVFGDIGPTGKLLEPYGTYREVQFYDNFIEQASILAEGGVDGLIVETMTDLREANLALKACRDVTKLPVIVTLSFAAVEKGGHTVMGSSVVEVAGALEENGAAAVGANCGELSPEEMALIAAKYREHTTLPILIQPNAGRPRLVGGSTVYDMAPAEFAEGLSSCIENGASLLGGCCGTTPQHIRAAADLQV